MYSRCGAVGSAASRTWNFSGPRARIGIRQRLPAVRRVDHPHRVGGVRTTLERDEAQVQRPVGRERDVGRVALRLLARGQRDRRLVPVHAAVEGHVQRAREARAVDLVRDDEVRGVRRVGDERRRVVRVDVGCNPRAGVDGRGVSGDAARAPRSKPEATNAKPAPMRTSAIPTTAGSVVSHPAPSARGGFSPPSRAGASAAAFLTLVGTFPGLTPAFASRARSRRRDRARSRTARSKPVPQRTMSRRPLTASMRSLPLPPSSSSPPLSPATRRSLPRSPNRRSAPLPPLMRSLPSPPAIMSRPERPHSSSAPAWPNIRSAPDPPSSSSLPAPASSVSLPASPSMSSASAPASMQSWPARPSMTSSPREAEHRVPGGRPDQVVAAVRSAHVVRAAAREQLGRRRRRRSGGRRWRRRGRRRRWRGRRGRRGWRVVAAEHVHPADVRDRRRVVEPRRGGEVQEPVAVEIAERDHLAAELAGRLVVGVGDRLQHARRRRVEEVDVAVDPVLRAGAELAAAAADQDLVGGRHRAGSDVADARVCRAEVAGRHRRRILHEREREVAHAGLEVAVHGIGGASGVDAERRRPRRAEQGVGQRRVADVARREGDVDRAEARRQARVGVDVDREDRARRAVDEVRDPGIAEFGSGCVEREVLRGDAGEVVRHAVGRRDAVVARAQVARGHGQRGTVIVAWHLPTSPSGMR